MGESEFSLPVPVSLGYTSTVINGTGSCLKNSFSTLVIVFISLYTFSVISASPSTTRYSIVGIEE